MNRKIKDRAFQFTILNWKSLIVAMLPIIIITVIANFSINVISNGGFFENPNVYETTGTHSVNYSSLLSMIASIFAINLMQYLLPLANQYKWGSIAQEDTGRLNLFSSFSGLSETFFPILMTSLFIQLIVFLLIVSFVILVTLSFFYPIAILFLFLMFFVMVWILMRISMAEYIAVDMAKNITGAYSDYKDKPLFVKVLSAIKESWNLTRGRVSQMILLAFSLIGWVFLLIITLGLAILFVQPYFLMVQFSLYQEFVAQSFPNKINTEIL